MRGLSFGLGLALRLGLSPFDLRLRSRLLHRSIYARLGNHRGIRPRSLVHLRRSVVPTQLSAGFRHDRRSRKSHSGRREFLGARFGWRTHRAGFQRLPLLTESLDVLRLLSKPLSLDLIHLLESQLAVSVPCSDRQAARRPWEVLLLKWHHLRFAVPVPPRFAAVANPRDRGGFGSPPVGAAPIRGPADAASGRKRRSGRSRNARSCMNTTGRTPRLGSPQHSSRRSSSVDIAALGKDGWRTRPGRSPS